MKNFNVFKARSILQMNKSDLWSLEKDHKELIVIFDDGVLRTLPKRTIFSAYCWGIIKTYDKTPLITDFHIGKNIDQFFNSFDDYVNNNKEFTFKRVSFNLNSHIELLGKVLFNCFESYNRTIDIEKLCELTYRIVNDIYNDFTENLGDYVNTTNILDFINIVNDPRIKKINESVEPNTGSIQKTYDEIEKLIKDPENFPNNPISMAVRSKCINTFQVLQSIGPRGVLTDINSSEFRYPITESYISGIRTIRSLAQESRLGSKALLYQDKPLQETEYFNRELQLIVSTVETLYPGDCGSEHYIEWIVHENDLKNLQGVNYLDGNKISTLKITDKHLINKKLKLRSPMLCNNKNSRYVCSTCFGDLSISIPKETNLGFVSATVIGEKISQSVLAIKHVEHVSGESELKLNSNQNDYFKIGKSGNNILLSNTLSKIKFKVFFSEEEAKFLNDVNYTNDVGNLEPMGISNIETLYIELEKNGRKELITLSLSQFKKIGYLTHEFLEYIKRNFNSLVLLNENNFYEIEMSRWDFNLPIIEIPKIHVDMLRFMKIIKQFLFNNSVASKKDKTLDDEEEDEYESDNKYTGKKLKDFKSYESALQAFYFLITSKLDVNLAHLQVILKAFSTTDALNNDFNLPKPGGLQEFNPYSTIMFNRSLGVAMAWQYRSTVFNNPATYLNTKRQNHYFDKLLHFDNKD